MHDRYACSILMGTCRTAMPSLVQPHVHVCAHVCPRAGDDDAAACEPAEPAGCDGTGSEPESPPPASPLPPLPSGETNSRPLPCAPMHTQTQTHPTNASLQTALL